MKKNRTNLIDRFWTRLHLKIANQVVIIKGNDKIYRSDFWSVCQKYFHNRIGDELIDYKNVIKWDIWSTIKSINGWYRN